MLMFLDYSVSTIFSYDSSGWSVWLYQRNMSFDKLDQGSHISCNVHHFLVPSFVVLAQLVERVAFCPEDVGSIPTDGKQHELLALH